MRTTIMRLAMALAIMTTGAAGAVAQEAGRLIEAAPLTETPGGMQAWKIRYVTQDEAGRTVTASGVVVAPREALPTQPRRVIAWAHGTWGVAAKCGPSLSPRFFEATPALSQMVAKGYVVVAPDYPGLGSDAERVHPYLAGVDTARSVIDAVRAARGIAGAGVGPRYAVWGESQGGHAALWTAAQAKGYAPDLMLVGTAAAAPPTALAANLAQASDANARAMLTAFLAYSWNAHYGAPLASLFNRTNQGVATRLARNNCIALDASPKLGTVLGVLSVKAALKNKDIGRISPWSALARRNSIAAAAVPGPLLLAQSVADPIVAPAVTRAFAQAYCRSGRPLRWLSLPGGDHGHSARDSADATLAWIDARFAGAPLPNDCAAAQAGG